MIFVVRSMYIGLIKMLVVFVMIHREKLIWCFGFGVLSHVVRLIFLSLVTVSHNVEPVALQTSKDNYQSAKYLSFLSTMTVLMLSIIMCSTVW